MFKVDVRTKDFKAVERFCRSIIVNKDEPALGGAGFFILEENNAGPYSFQFQKKQMLSGIHKVKQVLLIMMLAFATSTLAQQHRPEDSVRYLPKTKLMRATISGYSYDSILHISKDLLKNGFTVDLSDKSF